VTPFPEKNILPTPQQKLWPDLVAATRKGFVLYGGTAIALYLGHRESVDFDFFSDNSFDPEALIKQLPFLQGGTVLQATPDTLTVLVQQGDDPDDTVKVSLFGGLEFGRIQAPTLTPDRVIAVASKIDLLGHKLKVLLQREESKDYQDIDALLTHGLDLATGLGAAQALFKSFPPMESLRALTYFSKGVSSLDPSLKARLVAAVKKVRSIPTVVTTATSLI
jgi:hypothetical protein